MPHRYKKTAIASFAAKLRPFAARRKMFRKGYSPSDFRSDAMPGCFPSHHEVTSHA